MARKTQLLLVDDHAVLRAGLKLILDDAGDLEVVAEAGSVTDARAMLKQHQIDVILLDLTLGNDSGMQLLTGVKTKTPQVRVLVLSAFREEQYAVQALKAGADGYLNKESAPELLIEAVRRVAAGNKYISPNLAAKFAESLAGAQPQGHEALSAREFQILRMIAAGSSLVAIADELHLSTKTVTSYRARVLEKLGLATNAELVRYALERGLLE